MPTAFTPGRDERLAFFALVSRFFGEPRLVFTELPFFATGFPSADLPTSRYI
jgi:hypothetical protein